jgi:NAD(P)-dependent dehydrogenase (short-subunit alcohol dehydrogenase family)
MQTIIGRILMSKKILVTGANGGFGTLITQTLVKAGHTVVGSMRDPKGRNAEAAQSLSHIGAHVVDIDVTDQSSVDKGIEDAINIAGGLDVVINNAGVGVIGLQEAYTAEDFQRLFDINVFGVQRVTRAALNQFHQQQSGLILNISSILGRMTIPFYGPYNASKWAVEALSENYRTELSSFGIDVAIIEPGGFPTSFFERLVQPSDTERLQRYGEMADAPQEAFEGFEQALADNPAQNPQLVANAVLNVINTPAGQRPFRTVVDKMGMGEPIVEYNSHLDKVTQGIYTAFGTADMLELQV